MSQQVPEQQKPAYLRRRAIVPAPPAGTPQQPLSLLTRLGVSKPTPSPLVPDLDSVQGDVCFLFPKRWERFLFFRITDAQQFRKDLGVYAPRITSASQTRKNIEDIDEKGGKHRDIVSSGIAFARAGLNCLGLTEELQDPHFDKGSQLLDRNELGDQRTYDSVFSANGNTHGIILVATRERDSCEAQVEEIKDIFKGSIEVVQVLEGHVRPGEREHFGWRDGISQPALESVSIPKPGQRVVKPGVIVMGYPGDPLYGTQSPRPAFTKDGSFMVFRKLEQNVLALEEYTNNNWASIRAEPEQGVSLDEQQRKDLFEARLVGRFKSGVPLALCPYVENVDYLDPDLIDNFDYTERDAAHGCPFAAHIRKTSPRNLQPIVSKEFLDASVLVRAGIPYGDEISREEREEFQKLGDSEKENLRCERGLNFVCYQSSIQNGFLRQATGFNDNKDWFRAGPDPIIGGGGNYQNQTRIAQEGKVTLRLTNDEGVVYEVTGVAKKVDASVTSATSFAQKFFVTSRGGEYYFVPGIRTVNEWSSVV